MLRSGLGFLLDVFFTPFYKSFVIKLLGFLFFKYPFYKQWQYVHFRLVRGLRNKEAKKNFIINRKTTFSLYLNPGADFHQHSLFVAGIYERGLTSYISRVVMQYHCFVDVGAYLGYYTVLSAALNPTIEIYSIEPSKEAFDKLKQNVEANQIKFAKLYNCAAGADEKKAQLYKNHYAEQNTLINQDVKNNDCQQTDVKRIDDLIKAQRKNVLVKIDVEGYEFEVVKGITKLMKENNCAFVFEFNPKIYTFFSDDYATQMLKFFITQGYSLFEINDFSPEKLIDDIKLFIKKNKNKQSCILAKNN